MTFKYLAPICILLSTISYADVCSLSAGAKIGNSFNGPTSCGVGNVSSVKVNGPVDISGTIITDTLTINGPLTAQKSKVNNLVINGPINSSSSTFNIIRAHGNIMLTDSMAGSVIMPDSGRANDPEKICLIGKTSVKNITFDGGNGIVYKQQTAKITGKALGATIKDFSGTECLD